ncbi:flavin monoamine oxidase family protein [Ideonella benzenivorans]|uniref:flavin monoamine oxidase family protein n=1 Tax=Ideonella benzenivorans TaxID=2831643 RepID=UPI001CEDF4C5|nr:FAD-dependent oxidoreductase [Ideonella benzenivorans]
MDKMLDVAIVGGGVCGLALAHSLQARRLDWALFEARERLGGRVLTATGAQGQPLDLGPTWYWPGHQPSMARLVADLGLDTVAQADDGRVLLLDQAAELPATVTVASATAQDADAALPAPPGQGSLHGGAHRLAGGMGALAAALTRPLPLARLHLGQTLLAVTDAGDHVRLSLRLGGQEHTVRARRVVLALPPRVAQAGVRFEPALPVEVNEALQAQPTWMATAAKAAVAYPSAFWRADGHSGNAWVTHAQAVLAEVFDASGPAGAALAGFSALAASQRPAFARSMPLLVESQMAMLFGEGARDGELHWQDWAEEPFTCSPLDRATEALAAHPEPGAATDTLQLPQWDGRLLFGGAETAQRGTGYLEGALGAAARLRHLLQQPLLPARPPEAANDAQLRLFGDWVAEQRGQAVQRYRQRLHQALSRQQDAQLTQRALVEALESLYTEALQHLDVLPLQAATPPAQGRAALTPQVLAPFHGLADELLVEAVRFNSSSCALSNFPFEHQPSREYLATIRRDLAAVWQAFALAANDRLLRKADTATGAA